MESRAVAAAFGGVVVVDVVTMVPLSGILETRLMPSVIDDVSESRLVARGSLLGTDLATDGGGPMLSVLEKGICLDRSGEAGGEDRVSDPA